MTFSEEGRKKTLVFDKFCILGDSACDSLEMPGILTAKQIICILFVEMAQV